MLTRAPAGPPELDRATAGLAERLAEQRVDRDVEGVDPGEPGRVEVLGMEPVGGGTVGHERPLPAGRDHDTDPPGADARDANGSHADLVGAHRLDERASGRVPPDRRHERGFRPEPAQPAGGRRRRPTLHERHRAGHVGAALERALGPQDDVEHQVADHDDPWGRGRAAGSGAGPEGWHAPRIARATLQPFRHNL